MTPSCPCEGLILICPNCGHDNVPGAEQCAGCEQDLTHLDRPQPLYRIEQEILEDRVRDLELTQPPTIRADETVQAALTALVKHKVGALLVVDRDDKLVGLLSERDIALRYAGQPGCHADLPVEKFMTPAPVTVTPSEPLAYVLQKMDAGNYRHLPVVEDGRIVGMVSVRGVLRFVARRLRSGSH
jgi:CBS domain-containing protein